MEVSLIHLKFWEIYLELIHRLSILSTGCGGIGGKFNSWWSVFMLLNFNAIYSSPKKGNGAEQGGDGGMLLLFYNITDIKFY